VIAVVASLAFGPGIGIIAGGLGGPLVGMAVPLPSGVATVELGSTASAERYSMPGTHLPIDAARSPTDTTDHDAAGLP
jgi:hypothetical protein